MLAGLLTNPQGLLQGGEGLLATAHCATDFAAASWIQETPMTEKLEVNGSQTVQQLKVGEAAQQRTVFLG